MSETSPPAQTPMSDLFATAVHRFGSAWADLMTATVAMLAVASIPVAAVRLTGGTRGDTFLVGVFAYSIAYFSLLGFVMLRGLPERAPRRRVVWTYMTAGLVGIMAGAMILPPFLGPLAIVPMPLFLFAVPAIAAGDVAPGNALVRSIGLAVRNFSRTWLVWLITILFSAPVILATLLIVSAFASDVTSTLIGVALAVPIVWPFSALFVRALYGDLTGRTVVAPQDRTA